jgi:hypothetical protein
MTTTDLAKDVLELLDTQQQFFKTKDYKTLQLSIRLEKKLRGKCNAIVAKTSGMADLFDTPNTSANARP